MDIKSLYEKTELTQAQIAERLGISQASVSNYAKRHYSSAYRKQRKVANYSRSKQGDRNPMFGVRGAEHHNYVGVVSDGKGYLMVLKPDWYTGRKGSKHIFLHHVVVCEALGLSAIPRGWCVHHCDENTQNNRLSNLVLLTLADHVRLHQWLALKGATTMAKASTLKWVEAHGTPFSV